MGWRGRLLFVLFLGAFVLLQWGPRIHPIDLSDRGAHALMYYAFALGLWPLLPATDALARAGAVVSIGFLVAIVLESGQAHFADRVPDSADVFADLVGLFIGAVPMAWAAMNPASAGGRP